MTEHHIQNAIIDVFSAHGLYIVRINAGTVQNALTGSWLHLAPRGTSDLIGCDADGKICFLEIKTPNGQLSMEQIAFLREQHRKHRRWAVCTSPDDAIRFLKDPTYHGSEKHVKLVLDEKSVFVPTYIPAKKNAKMRLSAVNEFLRSKDGV